MSNYNSMDSIRDFYLDKKNCGKYFQATKEQEIRKDEIYSMLPENISNELFDMQCKIEQKCFDCGFKAALSLLIDAQKN